MASFSVNKPFQANNNLSYGQAFKQAGEAIGYGKENTFSWRGKPFNLEQESKPQLTPINQTANRPVGNNFNSADPSGSTQYGQGTYDTTPLTVTKMSKSVGKEIISSDRAKAIVNEPASLIDEMGVKTRKFEPRQTSAGIDPPKADRDYLLKMAQGDEELGLGDMEVDEGNYRQWDSGEKQDLGGIAKNFPAGGVDVPIDPDTHLSGGGEGFLDKDLMANITSERFSAPEMAGAESSYRGYDSGGFPIGSGGDTIGPPPTGFEGEGLAGLLGKGKGMLGKAGGALGKAGDFMKGTGGQAVMAGINILGEMGAMSARKDAMTGIDKSMAKLETSMEQATASRIAGFDAAEDAFQQGKGLVGTRLSDSMKGAFAGVSGSNIATGSRAKVKKDIRGQVSNQADMAIAGLETEMAKGKASVLQQSRGDRSKAKAAYADAKRQQDELKQAQKMGPLKMAASVLGVVNPAVGMAMNAGLSLYDAYG